MADGTETSKDAACAEILTSVMGMAQAAWDRYDDADRATFDKQSWTTGYIAAALEVAFANAE